MQAKHTSKKNRAKQLGEVKYNILMKPTVKGTSLEQENRLGTLSTSEQERRKGRDQ